MATKTSLAPDHLLARLFSADFPLEQVDLRSTSYSGLPFSAANTAILQKNITLSEDGGTKLMGKTGSALRNEKWVSGWFVGCCQRTAGTMSSPRTSKPRTAPTAAKPGR